MERSLRTGDGMFQSSLRDVQWWTVNGGHSVLAMGCSSRLSVTSSGGQWRRSLRTGDGSVSSRLSVTSSGGQWRRSLRTGDGMFQSSLRDVQEWTVNGGHSLTVEIWRRVFQSSHRDVQGVVSGGHSVLAMEKEDSGRGRCIAGIGAGCSSRLSVTSRGWTVNGGHSLTVEIWRQNSMSTAHMSRSQKPTSLTNQPRWTLEQ